MHEHNLLKENIKKNINIHRVEFWEISVLKTLSNSQKSVCGEVLCKYWLTCLLRGHYAKEIFLGIFPIFQSSYSAKQLKATGTISTTRFRHSILWPPFQYPFRGPGTSWKVVIWCNVNLFFIERTFQ